MAKKKKMFAGLTLPDFKVGCETSATGQGAGSAVTESPADRTAHVWLGTGL